MKKVMLVEYLHDPPITDETIAANGEKLGPCLMARSVNWLHSYYSNDRKRQVCVFEAVDAETVRQAFRSAGVRFERVWDGDFTG
jgi:Protein of unknown function (DUF4242)